jgi:cholinesterase
VPPGYKTQAGNPAGLLARSQLQNPDGVIFAALNYRLGMFGWLAGPGVEPNLGFYDQRLALDWLRKYVGLFGGDPDRITVMGESGGGGSIMHQITAFGGRRGRAPFQQAIIQSPAFSVQTDVNIAYAQVFATASALAGQVVNTVGELRGLNFSVLKQANEAVIRNSPYGSWAFNPTVDGEFVPNLPGILLMNGEFDRCVKVSKQRQLNDHEI